MFTQEFKNPCENTHMLTIFKFFIENHRFIFYKPLIILPYEQNSNNKKYLTFRYKINNMETRMQTNQEVKFLAITLCTTIFYSSDHPG